MENGIGLCPTHHRGSDFSAHGTPLKFALYLEAERPSIWNWIVENRERVERVDWKERHQVLKSEYGCIQPGVRFTPKQLGNRKNDYERGSGR